MRPRAHQFDGFDMLTARCDVFGNVYKFLLDAISHATNVYWECRQGTVRVWVTGKN